MTDAPGTPPTRSPRRASEERRRADQAHRRIRACSPGAAASPTTAMPGTRCTSPSAAATSAHARIVSIDTAAARSDAGRRRRLHGGRPRRTCRRSAPSRAWRTITRRPSYPLARGKVRYRRRASRRGARRQPLPRRGRARAHRDRASIRSRPIVVDPEEAVAAGRARCCTRRPAPTSWFAREFKRGDVEADAGGGAVRVGGALPLPPQDRRWPWSPAPISPSIDRGRDAS